MELVKKWHILLLLLVGLNVLGQNNYITKRLSVSDGLLANDIRTLCLDSNGVLWIGSRSGLTQIIQGNITANAAATEFRYTNVTDIIEDSNKSIWVSSYGQGVLYQNEGTKRLFTTQDGLISDRIRKFFIHRDQLYVGTVEGLSIININDFSIRSPQYVKNRDHNFEVSGFFAVEDKVYATTINDGTYLIDDTSLIKVNDIERVLSVYQYGDYVFYGCQFGLVVENIKTRELNYHADLPSVRLIKEINGQVVFVSSGMFENKGGIYKWEKDKSVDVTQEFNVTSTDLYSLAYDKVNDFLYVGSESEGLYKVDMFSALSYDTSIGRIMALTSHHKRLYVFAKNGLTIKSDDKVISHTPNLKFKQFQEKHYHKFQKLATKENHFFELDYTIPANKIIYYKAIVKNNAIWVSTNIGMFEVDLDGNILSYYNIHHYQFEFINNTLIESNPYGGVRVYSDIQQMKYDYHLRIEGTNIPRDIVDIKQLGNRLFFAGALDGLYSYSDKEGFVSLKEKGSFTERRLKMLAIKEPNKRMYVATDFNDIYCLSVENDTVKINNLISNEELFGTNINLLEVVNNKLIIGTNKGLTIITKTGKFYINEEQGMSNPEITSATTIGNVLYIGTTEGIYILDTQYFQPREQSLNVKLTRLLINGKEYTDESGNTVIKKELKLPYQSNSMQIGFNVLGAKYPDKLLFKYRLKLTENWNDVKGSKIDLHYLEAGIYPIDLKIYDFDSGTEMIYPLLYLEIEKPFYLKLWFFVSCGALIFLITYLVYRSCLVRLKQQQEVEASKLNHEKDKLSYEKRLAEVKLLSVRSQMNTHFIFNVLSSIQFYILDNQSEAAFTYLGKFSKFIRASLSLSSKERITLAEELDYLAKYVDIENMRLEGRMRFTVESHLIVELSEVMVPPMLLQPFVENSIVHAFPPSIERPEISIELYQKLNDIEIVITDNGIGSNSKKTKRHTGTSVGMTIVRERMSFIQDYLDEDLVTTIDEHGTRVVMKLKGIIK
ncbi:histidine kinase [Myroides sp. LoEW2-1]|uniref:sensor histidine kinase n=1 Tax=Myroides sp. LoEW2-1 TaxID=2683192 RepID=UPI00132B5E08|nr:histidine kinase [Myroides sp. LoEW2-1]MVX34991.1 sensor histidine kinase [Myroides sp. LoEW2-1]